MEVPKRVRSSKTARERGYPVAGSGGGHIAAGKEVRAHLEAEVERLNAFLCIRPSDEFAAQVGREVISRAIGHRPKRVHMTVNAS